MLSGLIPVGLCLKAPLALAAYEGAGAWAGSSFGASSGSLLPQWPEKAPWLCYPVVIPPQNLWGHPLAPPLHNPSRMQWTQEAQIFSLLQQHPGVPEQALCQASNCAVLNPSYFYSTSCNCQRCIRCLPLIVMVLCCLYKRCAMRATVNQFFASHHNENFCHITLASFLLINSSFFKTKLNRLSGTAYALSLDTRGT